MKIEVFIDGRNLLGWANNQNPGVKIDYEALIEWFYGRGEGRVHIYLPGRFVNKKEVDPQRLGAAEEQATKLTRWHKWLGHIGYRVVTKMARPVYEGGEIANYKGNFDVEIATDMTFRCLTCKPDEVYLLSGDSDFGPLLKRARNCFPVSRVILIGLPGQTAIELTRLVDKVIWLNDIDDQGIIKEDRGRHSGGNGEDDLSDDAHEIGE